MPVEALFAVVAAAVEVAPADGIALLEFRDGRTNFLAKKLVAMSMARGEKGRLGVYLYYAGALMP